jgi:hypothetical protein
MAEPAKTWKQKYGKYILWAVAWVATWLLGLLAGYLGLPAPPPIVVERQVTVPGLDEFGENAMGWVDDHEAIEAVQREMPIRDFGLTPAGQVETLPQSVYLWKAHEKIMGAPPPIKNQNPTGSCVGFGTTTSIERTLASEIALRGGTKEEFTFFSEEVTYAGSRYEAIGNRPPSFRGDGSNGSWAAKFVTEWGMVPKGVYGELDLRAYSATRARSWNNTGVPDFLEPTAKKFPVKSTARITNVRDCKAALASGYGVQMASSLGAGRNRDDRGVVRESGRWAHSMAIDGYHMDGTVCYFHVENSWDRTYHVGPVGWGNPTEAGFWIHEDAIGRALRQGDSWAFSGATGFPARKLPDWFVREEGRPERVRPFALFAQAEAMLAW